MKEITNEQIQSHFRILYQSNRDIRTALSEFSLALDSLIEEVQEEESTLLKGLHKKLISMAEALSTLKLDRRALDALDSYTASLFRGS
jgi:CRISPR/Cas system CSM-associated protein Csm2 small subunit